MYLSKIHLNLRCREVRRDLADPYQLHSTLCRAFCRPDQRCPPGMFMWRLEPESEWRAGPVILVQSRNMPEWSHIDIKNWLAEVYDPIDLEKRLKLVSVESGSRFRFRLRANPCVTKNGKRLGLLRLEEQEEWIKRKGNLHGFSVPRLSSSFYLSETTGERIDVRISQEQMLRGKQRSGREIQIFSVLYDGVLTVTDSVEFRKVIEGGIGHGKVMGLGLLSIAPLI